MKDKSKRNQEYFKIVEYNSDYKKKYKELNYEWIEKYFKIEPSDEKILSDPEKEIIDNNGFIFFALFNDEVIGTCTLIRHDDETYELSKLSVTENYKGKGAGEKLVDTAILKARGLGVKKIFLYTNKKLEAAFNLYNKKGFKVIRKPENLISNYTRESLYMDYNLNNDCDKDKLKLLLFL